MSRFELALKLNEMQRRKDQDNDRFIALGT
jgi:hypothetical protein